MDTWLPFDSITVAGADFRRHATISIGLNPTSDDFGSDGSPFSASQLTAFYDGPFNTELKWVDFAGLPDADLPTNASTPVLASNSAICTPAVNTSELTTAAGNLSLQFSDNAIPVYTSALGSSALSFTNTVQPGGTAGIADNAGTNINLAGAMPTPVGTIQVNPSFSVTEFTTASVPSLENAPNTAAENTLSGGMVTNQVQSTAKGIFNRSSGN
jgi:hypothetical protein